MVGYCTQTRQSSHVQKQSKSTKFTLHEINTMYTSSLQKKGSEKQRTLNAQICFQLNGAQHWIIMFFFNTVSRIFLFSLLILFHFEFFKNKFSCFKYLYNFNSTFWQEKHSYSFKLNRKGQSFLLLSNFLNLFSS